MTGEYAENYVTKNLYIKSKPAGKFKYLLFIFSVILLLLIIIKINKEDIVNPVIDSYALTAQDIKIDKKKIIPVTEIKTDINKELANTTGTFSVYFYDLKTGDNFGINEDIVLTAASVNKIPILAALYHLAGKDEIDLDKIIVPQQKDIQDYGTGSMRYDKPGTPYSIKTLARLMMEKSDNTAAYLLASVIIGMDEIQKLLEEWGLTQTDMENNKTSVKDMFVITKKIYNGEISSEELNKEMVDFMDDSDFEDRISRGVPETITFYHKTGDEVGKVHDVGIVDLPERPYFLGILTTDVTDVEETKDKIARISRIVFSSVAKS